MTEKYSSREGVLHAQSIQSEVVSDSWVLYTVWQTQEKERIIES